MLISRMICLIVAVWVVSPVAVAQVNASQDFDPQDFTGVWFGFGGGGGIVPFGPQRPELTPDGFNIYVTRRPSQSHDLRVPAVLDPALSNDPAFACNPRGFPRIIFDTAPRTLEFIHIADRILQLHQRERTLREFWVDGRDIPTPENMDNIGPSWYGHSVAEWDDDTLVVITAGMDERAWLDTSGNVKSFEARIEERYRRVDADTIEMQMTLNDPGIYMAPWVSDVKVFKRESPERLTFFNWYGMYSGVTDLMCAPLNSVARRRQSAY